MACTIFIVKQKALTSCSLLFILTYHHIYINSDGFYMVVAGQHEKTTSDNVNVTGGLRQIVLVDDVIMVGKTISL